MADLTCALLIIGAGPGGYVCGIRAAQLGIDTIVVEEKSPGGTCLNVGCIPSKALIHAADEFYNLRRYTEADLKDLSHAPLGITATGAKIDLQQTINWKDNIVSRLSNGVTGLLKKVGVKVVHGTARFRDGKNVTVKTTEKDINIQAENVVIAAGSEAIELASIPFSTNVISSTEALSLSSIPTSLAVVGGGYIGLEIGTAFAKLGSTVTIVEAAAHILPQYDDSLSKPILDRLIDLGATVLCQSKATTYSEDSGQLNLVNDKDEPASVLADKVLVTVGRKPRLHGWGLSELSLTMNSEFIDINSRCQTSMRGVYAIGDVTGEPMLAHRAMAQGAMVAEIIAGQNRDWDKVCIPAVCFTDPEIVVVGLTPEDAQTQGIATQISQFPFSANGRAMSIAREDGFIRVVSREADHAIIGVQAVGSGIAELSAVFSLAIEMGSRTEDIAATVHAHPTMSEGFQEACLKALGQALHF